MQGCEDSWPGTALPSLLPSNSPSTPAGSLCHWDEQGWGLQAPPSKGFCCWESSAVPAMRKCNGEQDTNHLGTQFNSFHHFHISQPSGSVTILFPSASKKPKGTAVPLDQHPQGSRRSRESRRARWEVQG